MDVLQTALQMAKLGYRVFPITGGGKVPVAGVTDSKGRGGFYAATDDPRQIQSWFSLHPGWNLAVATRGLVVVDVDPVDGRENPWLAENAGWLTGFSTVTPRGGRHFWFRCPEGIEFPNTAGKIAAGVDTRGAGGYVLVPPSRLPGGEYRLAGGGFPDVARLPMVPDHLQEVLHRSAAKPETMGVHQTMLETAREGVRRNRGVGEIWAACLRIHSQGHRADEPREKVDREIGRIIKHAFQIEAARSALGARLDFEDTGDGEGESGQPVEAAFSTREQRARGDRKKPLVGELIGDPSFGVIAAPPNIGKTAIAVGLTRCIADGVPLFRNPELSPARLGPVVVVELENDVDWADREVAFDSVYRQEFQHEVLVCNSLNLNDRVSIRAFAQGYRKQVVKYGPPVLLLVDTYGMAIAGTNENSASDIAPVIGFFRKFKTKGTSVVLLHHPTKSGSSAVRGAALRGAVDFVLVVEDRGSALEDGKPVYFRRIAVDKQRGGRKDKTYPFRMKVVERRAGDITWSAVVVDSWDQEIPQDMIPADALAMLEGVKLAATTIEGLGPKASLAEAWEAYRKRHNVSAGQGSKKDYIVLRRKIIQSTLNTLENSGFWAPVDKTPCDNKRFPKLLWNWTQIKPLTPQQDTGANPAGGPGDDPED